MFWRWQARLASVVFALALLALAVTPAINAQEAASVTIVPTEKAGTYEVQGGGFGRTELVRISATGPSGQEMLLAEHTSSADGYLSYTIRMPRHVEAGVWTITLTGADTGRTASGTLDMPLLGADVDLLVTPKIGALGTKFDFISVAFEASEVVSYWLTGPDAQVYLNGSIDATPTGRVAFSAIVGQTMPLGLWKMSAYGVTSDHLGIAEFTVNLEGGPSPAPATIATATVTAGDQPGTFQVRVTDFGRNEAVTMVATGPSGQTLGFARHTTTGDGSFDYQFRMPRYAEAGRWTLALTGESSGRTASAPFDMPLLGADIVLGLSAQSVAIGEPIAVSGGGFEAAEIIEYWLVGPDGAIYPSHTVTASTQGVARFTVTVSEGMPTGQWQVYAYGQSSDHLGVAPFTVS